MCRPASKQNIPKRLLLTLVALGVVGCTTRTFAENEMTLNKIGLAQLKYRTLVRDINGKYRDGVPREASDILVFIFSAQRRDVNMRGDNSILAARALLEDTNSVPPECNGNYSVIGYSANGSGAVFQVVCRP